MITEQWQDKQVSSYVHHRAYLCATKLVYTTYARLSLELELGVLRISGWAIFSGQSVRSGNICPSVVLGWQSWIFLVACLLSFGK